MNENKTGVTFSLSIETILCLKNAFDALRNTSQELPSTPSPGPPSRLRTDDSGGSPPECCTAFRMHRREDRRTHRRAFGFVKERAHPRTSYTAQASRRGCNRLDSTFPKPGTPAGQRRFPHAPSDRSISRYGLQKGVARSWRSPLRSGSPLWMRRCEPCGERPP